jgi:hypothetical protein
VPLTEPRVLAECAGCQLVEHGPRLSFVERNVRAHAVALFVLGLLVLIVGANGVLWLTQGQPIAAAFLGMATVLGVAFGFVLRAFRRRRALGLAELPALLVLDRAEGVLADGAGRKLAPLSQIGFRA